MIRTLEQWQAVDPKLCAVQNSAAANMYLIADAKADIASLASERDQLRAEAEALREAVKFASVVMGVVAENESLAEVEKRSLLCEVRRCDAAMAAKEG